MPQIVRLDRDVRDRRGLRMQVDDGPLIFLQTWKWNGRELSVHHTTGAYETYADCELVDFEAATAERLASPSDPGAAMPEQRPSVGRIVHYVSHGSPVREDGTQAYSSECRAAIITAVEPLWPDEAQFVKLCVLNPTGLFFDDDCQHDEDRHRGGTWHWPERT